MKFWFVYGLLIISCNFTYAQEKIVNDSVSKTNPITFYEFYGGFGGSDNGGVWNFGVNMNYEFSESNLLTFRYTYIYGFKSQFLALSPYTYVPLFTKREEQNEYAFLYGKRWVNKGHSISISGGISYLVRNDYKVNDDQYYVDNQNYVGLPLEINIKWFKKEKQRFRAYYGLIPTGKRKVSFGRAVGFKLIGNISENSYFGLSFTYGLGWHKKY